MLESAQEVLVWFATGKGRYAAAALLFIAMQAVKCLPAAKVWLNRDSGKWLGIAWTTKRKKAITTVLLSLAPAVPLLASSMPMDQVLNAMGEILAEAFGLKMLWNVVRKRPPQVDDAEESGTDSV